MSVIFILLPTRNSSLSICRSVPAAVACSFSGLLALGDHSFKQVQVSRSGREPGDVKV